ncbi:hypothetical protein D9M69_655990 [compost metagenome]
MRLGLEPQIKDQVQHVGTHHHALDDAEFQANIIMASLHQLAILAAFVEESNAFRAELDNGGAA